MEKILVQFTIAGLTTAQYDKVWEELREAGHGNPKGMLHHYGGVVGTNWLIIEIWESEELFNEFGKILAPFIEKNSVPLTQPIVLNLHYSFNQTSADSSF
jgi:hypothetical protein